MVSIMQNRCNRLKFSFKLLNFNKNAWAELNYKFLQYLPEKKE